jgi:hypothetical protein
MPDLISDTVSSPRCSPAVFGLKTKQFQPVDPDPLVARADASGSETPCYLASPIGKGQGFRGGKGGASVFPLYLTGKTERGPRRIRNGSHAAAQPRADKLLAGREFASLEDADETGRPGRYRRIGMAPEEMS